MSTAGTRKDRRAEQLAQKKADKKASKQVKKVSATSNTDSVTAGATSTAATSGNPSASNKANSAPPKAGSQAAAEEKQKYMSVYPHEGFMCKRDGNYAGVVMPNFLTCYGILLVTDNYFLGLHFAGRIYNQKLPEAFAPWLKTLKGDKNFHAFIVVNNNYPTDNWVYTADDGSLHTLETFAIILAEALDLDIEFTILKLDKYPKEKDVLVIHAAKNSKFDIKLRNKDEIDPQQCENFPLKQQSVSRFRIFAAKAECAKHNHDFPVTIAHSKKFLAFPEEQEWHPEIKKDFTVMREDKDAVSTLSQGLLAASANKKHARYFWARAIDIVKDGGIEEKKDGNKAEKDLYLLMKTTVTSKPLDKLQIYFMFLLHILRTVDKDLDKCVSLERQVRADVPKYYEQHVAKLGMT